MPLKPGCEHTYLFLSVSKKAVFLSNATFLSDGETLRAICSCIAFTILYIIILHFSGSLDFNVWHRAKLVREDFRGEHHGRNGTCASSHFVGRSGMTMSE